MGFKKYQKVEKVTPVKKTAVVATDGEKPKLDKLNESN